MTIEILYKRSPSPMITSLPPMMSDEFYVDPLLQYSQEVVASDHCCPLLWDVRRPPQSARRILFPVEYITPFYLSLPATYLPKRFLRIVCGMLPEEWVIEIRQQEDITIGDILEAIYTMLMRPIQRHEWERLTDKQRDRIGSVFKERCEMAADQERCRSRGVLRVDFLHQHILFAGLSLSFDRDSSCVLTLRRHPSLKANNSGG